MKKIFIFVCILCFFTFSLVAQDNLSQKVETEEKLNEIQFKIGMFPYIETLVCGLSTIGSTGNDIILPSLTVQYLHYVTPRIGLGAAFTTGIPVAIIGEDNLALIYTALQLKFRGIYMNKEKIKLYGEVGMGGELLLASDKEKDFMSPFFSGSIVPLGIWFGSDKFFGTTEITFGSEGSFLTLGCGFRF